MNDTVNSELPQAAGLSTCASAVHKLSQRKKSTTSLVAGAMALAIAGAASTSAIAGSGDKEKCYGVVKAGQNDCANASKSHSCAAQSTVDGDPGEWVALPKGLCAKLVGGSVAAGKANCKGKDSCEGKSDCKGKDSCEGKHAG